jgi:hypothetical protein
MRAALSTLAIALGTITFSIAVSSLQARQRAPSGAPTFDMGSVSTGMATDPRPVKGVPPACPQPVRVQPGSSPQPSGR